MDDEDVLVQQLVKSLAFEVEAVPAENIVKFTSTNGTPLNVRVRVRNKDEPRLVQRGLVSVPRITNQVSAPEKIRLINSNQTILSFNVYMETDLEKETQTPKIRKHGFNFLKFGGCLGTSVGEDDDKDTYIPETSNKSQSGLIIEEIEGSQQRLKLKMENSKIVARNHKGFFGKCKPGGCLDPPFSEDKLPYGLPKIQQQTKLNLALNKDEESKDNRSYSISSVEPRKLSKLTDELTKKGQRSSKSQVESKPLVNIFARTSSSQNSLGSNHSNIITYPPRLSSSEMIRDNQDTRKKNKSKSFNESPRQSNENPVAYFVPPKDIHRHKEEERKYSRELSNDQIRINDDNIKDGTTRNNGNRKRSSRNHLYNIPAINNAKFSEIKSVSVSASQGREESYPKRVKQTSTSTDITLNDKDNVRILQERKNSDILLITPHVDEIENITNRSTIPIQSVSGTDLNNLGDFDNKKNAIVETNKDDMPFQTKSQLKSLGISEYNCISSDDIIEKKDNFYDAKDKTKKDKTMPTSKTLDSEREQILKQSEIPTEFQSQSKKTKLKLRTIPNLSSSLQNLLDTSDLNSSNIVVSDTSSQDTQTKAKKDTNTYPSTSADADKIETFPQNIEKKESQTRKDNFEDENRNKDFNLLKNGAEVPQSIHQEQYLKQDVNNPDLFHEQTYNTPPKTTLQTEMSNKIAQDQNNQLNNLGKREFKNCPTDDRQKEQFKERVANINGIKDDNLNDNDKQNIIDDLKTPIYNSQTQNGLNNIKNDGVSASHVIKPFMIENGEQIFNDYISQTRPITDSTGINQANKKPQKSASHASVISENKEFATYSTHSLDSHRTITSTYDDTKIPVNIQYHQDKTSGSKIVEISSVDHVIIQNDNEEKPDTESREMRSSLLKIPFSATRSDLFNDDTNQMIPLKHKAFPIVKSNKSIENQIEEISTLQNLTPGGTTTENDDKYAPQSQARKETLHEEKRELAGCDSATNLTNLGKQTEILPLSSDKEASEIIGILRKGNITNVDNADSTYFQPKYQNISTTETDSSKINQNQITPGLHEDDPPLSLSLPSSNTKEIDNMRFKSHKPLKPDGYIDDTMENWFDNRIDMDLAEDTETKQQGLMDNQKLLTSTSSQYFIGILEDKNAQLTTKPGDFHDINISQCNINRLADQLSSFIIKDEGNKEVSTLPISYTLEDGTTMVNPTMDETYIDSDKISAIKHQETSGGNHVENVAMKYEPLLPTVVNKMDTEFNADYLYYADTDTLGFNDMKVAPLKSTIGDYNLEKTVPLFDEFSDDTIHKRLGLGVRNNTNNKKVKKQKDGANVIKKTDSEMARDSTQSIDETRSMIRDVSKLSNKSTPISKFLDTDTINQTELKSFDILAKPKEKGESELLLNIKFQTYMNENNDIVVQTLDPLTEAQNLENANVTFVNRVIRPGNEIRIQVDSKHNLTLRLDGNYHRERDGHREYDERKAYQHVGLTQRPAVGVTQNEIVLHENLSLLYESELVPLYKAIMSLTEEINALSANQELLKAKLQGAKRTISMRLIPVSKHCGCKRS